MIGNSNNSPVSFCISYFGSMSAGGVVDLIEVETAAEMDALLAAENVGKAYKYVGMTDENYTNGDIYVVEES